MTNSANIARTAVMVTVAVLLGYVESIFPPPIPIPGIKIGLANMVIIIVMYTGSRKNTFLVAFLKVLLCAMLFGSPMSFIYSLSGAAVSVLVMMAAKHSGLFSLIGVSSVGGIFHNMAQLVCAYFFIGKGVLFHIPVLCLTGAVCGVLTGVATQLMLRRGGDLFDKK